MMRCDEITRVLLGRAGKDSASPLACAVQRHLDACEECRALAGALENGVGDDSFELSIRDVLARVGGTLRPVSPLPARWLLLLATAVIFVLIPAIFVALTGAAGLRAMSPGERLAVFGSIAAAEILVSGTLVSLMVPGSQLLLNPQVLLVGCPLVFAATVFTVFRAGSLWSAGAGLGCFVVGTGVAMFAALSFWLLARRGAVLSWRWTGPVIGLLAGLVGVAALGLECDILERAHQSLGHGAVLPACVVAGLLAGTLASAVRRRRSWSRT
jgi:hypothetical protein